MMNTSLISIPQLCDDDCNVLFNKQHMYTVKNNEVILKGNRNTTDRLWDITIPTIRNNTQASQPQHPPMIHQANIIIQRNQAKSQLAEFLHAACYAQTKSTFIKAIKNNHFISWSGLDPQLITKHLGVSEHTIKGHMTCE